MARGDVMALYWHTKAAKQGLATAQDRGYGEQEALRTYRDNPLFPALGISISISIMRDGGWCSEAMVARYTEHLQVKQGASAILAARQARL